MFDAARAILYSIAEAGLSLPSPVLVINDAAEDLKAALSDAVFWNPETDGPEKMQGKFKTVILFAPKQKEETRYLMAIALETLGMGGVFVTTAANEAGGKILAKNLAGFGVAVTDISKHKCRVVWTNEPQRAAKALIAAAKEKGGVQKRADGMWSQPGLFSWDHLDKGTDALLHHLPFSLSGKGADFGCGIGPIGLKLMQRYKDIKSLACLDRDVRALVCCRKNLVEWNDKIITTQADLTKPVDLQDLDFIVMNPPFHTGKKQSAALGQAFIGNAAKSLKTGGILVFVANSHLPYEATLAGNFSFYRILSEAHGFKIIEAIR